MTTTEPIAAYPVQAGAPEPPRRMQRWVFVATVVWVVVLVGAFAWAVRRGEPTAREQTTMADAVPVMTHARAELARAATADGLAVVALTGIERSECDVSVARPGIRLQAPVLAFVAPGTEEALMRRVADRLPASYEASVRTGSAPRLNGDAGLWVAVAGAVIAPGQVRFVADTGSCRPESSTEGVGSGPPGDRAPAQAALDEVGLSGAVWIHHVDGCAGSGRVSTVEGMVAAAGAGSLDEALPVPGAEPVVATPELVAYRVGPAGVAARLVNDQVVVTSTTLTCR